MQHTFHFNYWEVFLDKYSPVQQNASIHKLPSSPTILYPLMSGLFLDCYILACLSLSTFPLKVCFALLFCRTVIFPQFEFSDHTWLPSNSLKYLTKGNTLRLECCFHHQTRNPFSTRPGNPGTLFYRLQLSLSTTNLSNPVLRCVFWFIRLKRNSSWNLMLLTCVTAHLYKKRRTSGFMYLSSFCSKSGCVRSIGLSFLSRQ